MNNSVKAVAGGVGYVIYYLGVFVKTLCVPFVLLILISSIALTPELSGEALGLARFLQWIPLTLIAITTHRIILDGPYTVPTWGINRFGLQELKFFAYQFVVAFAALPAIIFSTIPFVGILLTFVAIAYIIARLSLVFPAIAIGKPFGLKDSWRATQDHQLMMLVVVVVFPVFLGAIDMLVGMIPGMLWASIVISTLTTVFVVASLSVAYKIIMERGSQD